jgi:hypothetical protein
MTCALTNAFTITTTQTWSINAGISLGKREASSVAFVDLEALQKRDAPAANPTLLKAGFELGATYSFSKSLGYTVSEAKTQPLEKDQCGYWTFVPYTISSHSVALPVSDPSTSMPRLEYTNATLWQDDFV